MRVSKGFQAAGWAASFAGDVSRNMGSALAAFVFMPPEGFPRVRTLWRVRLGKRLAILERRRHGTPTGRCSAGHWERIDTADTPTKARAWTGLGRFWAYRILESIDPDAALRWDWRSLRSRDRNRCGTRADANSKHPTLAGGSCGRGKIGRGLPTRHDTFGFSPATGQGVVAHDARKAREVQRQQRRTEHIANAINARIRLRRKG